MALTGYWVKLQDESWGSHISCIGNAGAGATATLTKKDGTKSSVEIVEVLFRYDCYGICRVREIEQTETPRRNGATKQQQTERPNGSATFTRNNEDEWVVRIEGEYALDREITIDVAKKDGSSQRVRCTPYWTGDYKGRPVTIAMPASSRAKKVVRDIVLNQ